MSELTNALNRILNWFDNNKPSTIESLQPGLTIEEIEEKAKDLPFRLTQEVYELYQWKNGMIDDGSCFFECYRFLPFGWLPIFEFEGDYSAVICAEEKTESSLILDIYEDTNIAHQSLTNMMCCIAECYETGAFYIDESGNLEENEVAKDIYRKYEPDLNLIDKAKVELVDNPDGSQVINKYHLDSNIILESRVINKKGHTIESNQYFQGKLYNRLTYNHEIEGFDDYFCEENWFNDYEKYEKFTVEYQYKCAAPKIERRYINGVLKK